MSGKVVDPDNARLVAMLRAMGEEVPEELLQAEGRTKKPPEQRNSGRNIELKFPVSRQSETETWAAELELNLKKEILSELVGNEVDEANEPLYVKPSKYAKVFIP